MKPYPALSARDLCATRGRGANAFELRVDALDLFRGESLAVLGPNGAGKSTLLRTLAGLEPGARGHLSRGRGPVTMVFQRPIAFAGSVEHNVRVALRGSGLRGAAREERVRESLAHFDIAALAARHAQTLSGGELQRLALARAFALRPGVLLLDEPFDNLDAPGQERLSHDLRRLLDSNDIAIAMVTHDLRQALLLSDRIAVLLDGRLRQLDRRDVVLEHPASAEIARLVGMSNLLPGRVRADSHGERAAIEIEGAGVLLARGSPAPGSEVIAGIRPEHLKVETGLERSGRDRGSGGDATPIGKGTARSVVSDGSIAIVTVEWGGHLLRTHLLAGRGLARTVAPGDALTLAVRPDDVHLIEG